MRNLIYAINLTIDGCCDHTKMIADEEMHDYHTQLLRDSDTLVYGRKTYQLMVPYWPDVAKNQSGETKAEIEFAQAFQSISRLVVFSKTLDKTEEHNPEIFRANLKDEVMKLKQQPGKNILTGGADIPSQLIELGLVDQYHIVVHPVFAGKGRRLLEGISLEVNLQLKLAASKTFKSGCIALHYVRR